MTSRSRLPSPFRHDINALRAIAVVLVVLFHFRIAGFSAGFVGVDVFFVVSGYLMTGILVAALERHTRPALDLLAGIGVFWHFLLARIRRIVPALLVLSMVLLVAGWWLLPANEYRMLAAHTLHAVLFVSNQRFFGEAGYFDAASHEKWMLHTWSLSVEWQFYLLLPVVCVLVWRFWPRRSGLAWALGVLGIASLAVSIHWSIQRPEAAFFLLPSRAWQMLSGGLVFLFAQYRPVASERAGILQAIGIGLILVTLVLVNASSPWPGLYAMVPVAGTMAVLYAAHQAPWTQWGAVDRLGRWSYSIYLWHWPVWVLLMYLEVDTVAVWIGAGMVVSVLLGALSYRWVEEPGRRWLRTSHAGRTLIPIGSVAALVMVACLLIHVQRGVPQRLPDAVNRASAQSTAHHPDREQCHARARQPWKWCHFGDGEVQAVVVGDSHAMTVMGAVVQAARELAQEADTPRAGTRVEGSSYTSCPSVFGARQVRTDLDCQGYLHYLTEQLSRIPSSVPLIVANRFSGYVYGDQGHALGAYRPVVYFDAMEEDPHSSLAAQFFGAMESTLCRLAETRPVLVVQPIPEMPASVPSMVARRMLIGRDPDVAVARADYLAWNQDAIAAMQKAASRCNVQVLDVTSGLCEGDSCPGSEQGLPLYYDSHHLTEIGNRKLVPMFKAALVR